MRSFCFMLKLFCLISLLSKQVIADVVCTENNKKLSIIGSAEHGYYNAIFESEDSHQALKLTILEESKTYKIINSLFYVLNASSESDDALIAEFRLPLCTRNGCIQSPSKVKLILDHMLWKFSSCVWLE